ncbi:MAG TPA: UDP-galactopyranose mutase [Acidimicrobiales bacterium]|nr:UDP-galactopyranose mutase [Acidimicrobiales bacterium]
MRFDWLVVGAGLSGATLAERIANERGQSVLVVDRRHHIAGNAYDEVDEAGVRVHRYGAHIFHTVSDRVWTYMSRFTDWLPYTHKVMGRIDGLTVPLPFNLTTLHALLPGAAHALERRLVDEVGAGGRIPVLTLLEHSDPALCSLGEFVYEKVFLHYTMKQWGFRPEEIDRSVTGRVPVVVSHDDRYFHDRYQGIPAGGYTALVARMLDQPGITVETGVDFRDVVDAVSYDRMVYTGPIDEFFDLSHGPLPYRSLRFEHSTVGVDRFQPAAVVNFPDGSAYTRIIEHAQFSDQHLVVTTITHEYPESYERGRNEPYYPLPQSENRRRYELYAADAAELRGRVVFSGRLAEYKYYDMDQAVAHALTVFRNQIADGPRDRAVRLGTGAAR